MKKEFASEFHLNRELLTKYTLLNKGRGRQIDNMLTCVLNTMFNNCVCLIKKNCKTTKLLTQVIPSCLYLYYILYEKTRILCDEQNFTNNDNTTR